MVSSQAPSQTPLPESAFPITPRTALKRRPDRGSHERSVVHAILDEALICHAAVVVDGAPCVLPMAYARISDHLYLHGAPANRILGALTNGAPACIVATLLDGLVFARTWFHHSMNFRSVVLYGRGSDVVDPEEKLAALAALVDKAAPGRAREARAPTPAEMRSVLVARFPIVEASAKVRTGPPIDERELWSEDVWAGVLPLQLTTLPWKDDHHLRDFVAPSVSVGERARTLASGAFRPYECRRGDLLISTDPTRIDFAFVHRFLAEESYWARGIQEQTQRLAMSHSLCFGLYRGNEQIGFARVLTDYGRLAYLGDVFVSASARGQGLGQWLVASALDHPDLTSVDRWLLGTADAHGLYERFGFTPAENGRYMVRQRGNT
jgi:nitroimidazol reductase NimA-like FMN-containing flavoprotein (pyridoxamine 5'-phosphate oxidase superfamily)/GNAT superfamily N-acetyltransferase